MNKSAIRTGLIVLCIGITMLASEYANAQEISAKKVPLVQLTGTPYERGLQHGKQLKDAIAEVFGKWKANIRNSVKGDPDSLLAVFLAANDFERTTKKYSPDMLEEINGIAKGSGQSYKDVFAFQLVDEFWIYLDKQFNTKNHHCSAMGVAATKNHPAYIAQNTDLEGYMNGYQVLFRISATQKEPEQFILSCAGLVALNGMNGKGIGVCVNSLMELQASTDGLPVAFILRELLKRNTGKEALDFLQTVKHASGQNYILGIADNVYDFEASASQVVRYIPAGGKQTVVYHTNHALVNHDVKEWYQRYHQRVLAGETKNWNSESRFTALENRLTLSPEEISADVIKNTLRSKDDARNPVCRPYRLGAGFTFSSVVFTLGGTKSVQLTYGSPDQSEYQAYFFSSEKTNKR